MKNIFVWAYGLLFLAVLVSCSAKLTPFSQKMYEDFGWTENDLQQIQFYLSEDIVLNKVDNAGESKIEDGIIKVKSDREIKEIIFGEGTPGVMLFSPKKKRIAISFDKQDDSKFLMFGPNPKLGDQYVLLGSEWNKKSGIVTYGGEKYRISGSPFTKLLVDLKHISNTSVKSTKAGGRKI